VNGFDEFFGNLYHLNVEEEPELPNYLAVALAIKEAHFMHPAGMQNRLGDCLELSSPEHSKRSHQSRQCGLTGRTRRACLAGALIAFLSTSSRPALARTLVVGGKYFTEQLLMAELTSQLLNAKGFEVETRSGFDTNALRQAQEAGHIDLYWEYTGTSLREFNKVTERLTPAETYNRVKQLDAQKGLVWLEPSRVNNTYALAVRRVDATAKGISTISDLAAKVLQGERLAFASTSEFLERSDGLRPLEQVYGFEFARDRVVRVDIDLIYQMLQNLAFIDVGLVFATDGRVPAYDLLVLKDDKKFFPDYSMAAVVRREKLQQHPELAVHLERLAAVLDNETMARLNRIVDVERVPLRDVASEYLKNNGLI
jgi:osmoprotectant transport system substrate-binding protein